LHPLKLIRESLYEFKSLNVFPLPEICRLKSAGDLDAATVRISS